MFTTWFKPAGIPCFPPHADPAGDCALARIAAAHPERLAQDWPEGFDGGIAHRLDRWTSGALLLADDPQALVSLRALFADKQLTKTYRFLAARTVSWDDNACDRPIAHDKAKRRRMIVQRGPNTPHRGRWYEAHTRFRRVHGDLWEAVIHTGVMHQIRVHAAFVGIPLAGDRIYGGGSGDRYFLHHLGLEGPNGLRSDPVQLPEWAG